MDDKYWELIQFDGTRIEIPPTGVDVVKRRWDNGQPIHTARSGSIPANQIKAFRPTEKRFTNQPLLEAAAQAFGEPIYNDDGSVQAKWVKKQVTQREYDKHYGAIPGYRLLSHEGGLVTVAFRLATSDINTQNVEECTAYEIDKLRKT